MFVWQVEDEKLEKVNDFFGNYEFLVSWEKPSQPEKRKRLP